MTFQVLWESRGERGHTTKFKFDNLNLVVWPRSARLSHSSVVRASNQHLEGHGFDSCWEDSEFFSEHLT